MSRSSKKGPYVDTRLLGRIEDMNRAIEVGRLKPVIDRVFELAEARAAYEHLASGSHFGTVVIRVA